MDMFLCVERTDPEPYGPMDLRSPDLLMNERCTVESSARGDVVIHIQDSPRVKSFESIDIEQKYGDMIG